MSYNQHNVPGPEYRVRPIVRYVVTRYCHPYVHEDEDGCGAHTVSGGSTVVAEFTHEVQAEEIARILQNHENAELAEMAKFRLPAKRAAKERKKVVG